jgi:hypothetical protein
VFGVDCFLDSIPSIVVDAMASGSKEGESRVPFRLLAVSCSSPCMLVPSWTVAFL